MSKRRRQVVGFRRNENGKNTPITAPLTSVRQIITRAMTFKGVTPRNLGDKVVELGVDELIDRTKSWDVDELRKEWAEAYGSPVPGARQIERAIEEKLHSQGILAKRMPNGKIWVNPDVPDKLKQRVEDYEEAYWKIRKQKEVPDVEARLQAIKIQDEGLSREEIEKLDAILDSISDPVHEDRLEVE